MCLRPHGRSVNFYGDRNRIEVLICINNMNDNIIDDITLTTRNKAQINIISAIKLGPPG